MKGFTPGRFRKPAPLDDVFRATLREQDFGPDDVPPAGVRIRLRNLPNLPKGATHFDVTDAIHPDVRLMSETIAQTFGIPVCGLDYMTEDISKSCFVHGVF